jgi:hypothetical protein
MGGEAKKIVPDEKIFFPRSAEKFLTERSDNRTPAPHFIFVGDEVTSFKLNHCASRSILESRYSACSLAASTSDIVNARMTATASGVRCWRRVMHHEGLHLSIFLIGAA